VRRRIRPARVRLREVPDDGRDMRVTWRLTRLRSLKVRRCLHHGYGTNGDQSTNKDVRALHSHLNFGTN
jgi:hypothetical protein